jgi:hypothetical protein
MSFGQIIKGTLLPKVPLKELYEEDTSNESSNSNTTIKSAYKAPSNRPDSSQKTGATSPFVKIAGQIVRNIDTMVIDETQFIPRVMLTFTDGAGEFAGDYFPKVDLIMSLYLKVGTEKLKPVRCDFLITEVKSSPAKYTGDRKGIGIGTTYLIKGELYVPGIYNNVSKSYAGMNSKETLKRICEDLNLGFAENESSPNDKMTWINTNHGAYQFIQNIAKHAYQDDDSFFSVFIDKYYFLNYVEVNRQLKVEEAPLTFLNAQNALMSGISQQVKNDAIKKQLEEQTIVNYLTTELDQSRGPNYITSLNLISDQGQIIKQQGYKKNIFYYDHLKATKVPKEKFKDFFMAPLKSIDRNQTHYLVPTETSLAENKIKKWMNIDYGNNHPEWNAARLLNDHNLRELDKIKLRVTLNGINFQVVRGFAVPVYISVQEAEKIFKSTPNANDQKLKEKVEAPDLRKQTPDQQLSGYYYVSGAKYHYDAMHPNGLYTELFLARREWKPSKKTP